MISSTAAEPSARFAPPTALSSAAIRRIADAGAAVAGCMRILAKTGHNVVGEVLNGEGQFFEWNHYPESDAFDPETHSQYYYHAHPPEAARPFAEHGHFHLFLRAAGMPRGMQPAPAQSPVAGDGARLAHLVAISMDAYGVPVRLFTTNRWVTGDTWYRADDVIKLLDRFEMDVSRPNWIVNRWITAMVRLFQPQIAALLRERDTAVEAWRKAHPGEDTFEDRRLEITSARAIAIEDHLGLVAAARAAFSARARRRG